MRQAGRIGLGIGFVTRVPGVSAPAPVAAFSVDYTTTWQNDTLTFTNASTNATSYLWDFGDSTTSTSANPTKSYTLPGTYTVTLTATGAGGSDSEIKTNYITVNYINNYAGKFASGSSSSVSIPHDSALNPANFTLILDTQNNATTGTLISKKSGNTGWELKKTSNLSEYQFILYIDGTTKKDYSFKSPNFVSDSTNYTTIGVTYASGGSGTLLCYVNGVAVTPTKTQDNSIPNYTTNTANITIGSGFTGLIDNIRFYSAVLNGTQMGTNFNSGSSYDYSADSNIIMFIPFEGNSNDVVGSRVGTATAVTYDEDSSYKQFMTSAMLNGNVETGTTGTYTIGADTGGNLFSSMSEAKFTTKRRYVRIGTFTNVRGLNTSLASVVVYKNDVYHSTITHSSDNTYIETLIDLGDTNLKTVTLKNSGQIWNNSTWAVSGTFIHRIYLQNYYKVSDTATNPTWVFLGDSILNGLKASLPMRNDWFTKMKNQYTSENFYLYGGGNLTLKRICEDSTRRSATVSKIAPFMTDISGSYSHCKIWIELGVNDWLAYPWDSTAITSSNWGQLLDDLNTAYPGVTIYIGGMPYYRTNNQANGLGKTPTNYRTAITAQATGRSFVSNVVAHSYMEGSSVDFDADNVHPNDTGIAKLFNYFNIYKTGNYSSRAREYACALEWNYLVSGDKSKLDELETHHAILTGATIFGSSTVYGTDAVGDYLLIGKTSGKNAYNFRSVSSKYATFTGSPTHGVNGLGTLDGATQYMTPGIVYNGDLSANSMFVFVMLKDANTTTNKGAIGVRENGTHVSYINPRNGSGNFIGTVQDGFNTENWGSNADQGGLYLAIRTGASKLFLAHCDIDGSNLTVTTHTDASTSVANTTQYTIGAINSNGGVYQYSDNTIQRAMIGKASWLNGATDADKITQITAFMAEMARFNTAIRALI